jgi:hypothetical protein
MLEEAGDIGGDAVRGLPRQIVSEVGLRAISGRRQQAILLPSE